MAVARMLKVTAIALADLVDPIIDTLQSAGVCNIDRTMNELPQCEVDSNDGRLARIDSQLLKANYILSTLNRFHSNEQPMSMFVSEKHHINKDWYQALGWNSDYEEIYLECENGLQKTTAIAADIAAHETLMAQLYVWESCPVPLVDWRSTAATSFMAFTVGSAGAENISSQIAELTPFAEASFYTSVSDVSGVHIRAHHSVAAEVRSIVIAADGSEVSFTKLFGTVAEELAELKKDMGALHAEYNAVLANLQLIEQSSYTEIVALIQALDSARNRLIIRAEFGRTDATVVVTGWVQESDKDQVDRSLSALGAHIDVTFEQPRAEDSPPVVLSNPKWVQPFELLTDLYGRPKYGELDPTLALAPFFTLFFAICIGDVGYGLMLIATMIYVKTKLDVAPGVIRFCNMMIYGGIAAIPVGVAFGSYFALPLNTLPPFMQNMQLLDPLAELTTFLLLTLVIGFTQIVVGILIAAYEVARKGDIKGAIGSQLSTIFLMACIGAYAATGAQYGILLFGGLILTVLLQGAAMFSAFGSSQDKLWDRAIGVAWLASVFIWIGSFALPVLEPIGFNAFLAMTIVGLIASKVTRKAVVGALGGAYAIYGMTGIAGDALSYTRLAALGLSGGLVGMVFNILAGLVWSPAMSLWSAGGLGYIWGTLVALMAIVVFAVGHIFNVGINLLGAFVHPMRLQFVEFFSKFYEAGGTSFVPFSYVNNNLVFDARTPEAAASGTSSDS